MKHNLPYSLSRGLRFQVTFYYPSPPASTEEDEVTGVRLTRSNAPKSISPDFPIHASISALDREAMDILTLPPSTGLEAHKAFSSYLSRTKNTICGRHPIGVLLGALAEVEARESKQVTLEWVKYAQSSQCFTISDSSVNYASTYTVPFKISPSVRQMIVPLFA